MIAQPQIHTRHAVPQNPHGHSTEAPRWYSSIPRRLLTDLYDTPLAIGIYGLVARLHVIVRGPVPLSRADVLGYDPTLKPGAVKRAFDRLIAGGWLIQTGGPARQKHTYTPTWGRVKGAPLPWKLEEACHGRPHHIQRLMLDRNLFDICMGKLTPHPSLQAIITRYITVPALSLADIGCYALTLADISRETPNLRWLDMVRNGRAIPLPSEQRLLALISQRPLTLNDETAGGCDTGLTISGTRRLGLAPLPPTEDAASGQPLFFVPPGLIGSLIGPLIGSLIGQGVDALDAPTTPVSDEIRSDVRPAKITWESSDKGDKGDSTSPTLPLTSNGGGNEIQSIAQAGNKSVGVVRQRSAPVSHHATPEVPDTEATRLLRTINVRPEQQIELAELPTAAIEAAIADGQARDGVRDLAGWVVSLLRTHRDYGWKIHPPVPPADSPETLALSFARYTAQLEAERRTSLADHVPQLDAPPSPEPSDSALNMQQLWDQVRAALQLQIGRQEFNTWMRHVVLVSIVDGVAIISAPSVLVKTGLEHRYTGALRDLIGTHAGITVQLRIIIGAPTCELEPSNAVLAAGDQPGMFQAGVLPPVARPPDADHRPAWISVERWVGLPMMLRAALIGSTVINGDFQAASLHMARVLHTRYAHELVVLLDTWRDGMAQQTMPEASRPGPVAEQPTGSF